MLCITHLQVLPPALFFHLAQADLNSDLLDAGSDPLRELVLPSGSCVLQMATAFGKLLLKLPDLHMRLWESKILNCWLSPLVSICRLCCALPCIGGILCPLMWKGMGA